MPQTTCSAEGCDRSVKAKALCNAHYIRRARGVPLTARPIRGSVMTETCVVDDCGRDTFQRGWCGTHYKRWLTGADPSGPIKPRGESNAGKPCSVAVCDREAAQRGYCMGHYYQWWRRGVVTEAPIRETRTPGTGDEVGYSTVHWRLSQSRGPAASHGCVDCGLNAADWSYDHTDPDERTEAGLPYSVDPSHYSPRCRPCHKAFDMAAA